MQFAKKVRCEPQLKKSSKNNKSANKELNKYQCRLAQFEPFGSGGVEHLVVDR